MAYVTCVIEILIPRVYKDRAILQNTGSDRGYAFVLYFTKKDQISRNNSNRANSIPKLCTAS